MKTSFLKMPAMAMVLGIGLVISQSAFKPAESKRASVQYERVLGPSGVSWRLATGSTCNLDPSRICKAYFDYNPNDESEEYNAENYDHEQTVINGYVNP